MTLVQLTTLLLLLYTVVLSMIGGCKDAVDVRAHY